MNDVKLNVSESRGYEGVDLIKVTTNEEGQQLVSGRELYEVLKVQQDYSDWIKKQLGNVDAVENDDFTLLKGKTSKSGGRPGVEYILTVDIAKKLCLHLGQMNITLRVLVVPLQTSDSRVITECSMAGAIEKWHRGHSLISSISRLKYGSIE